PSFKINNITLISAPPFASPGMAGTVRLRLSHPFRWPLCGLASGGSARNPSNLVAADQKVPLESGKERHPRSIVNRCSSLSERNRACMEGLLPPSLAPDNHGTQSRHFQTSTSAITSFLTPLSITPRQNATIRA